MLVLAMVVASCVGVVQLHLIGSPTRSVRLGLVLACIPVGMYGATAVSLGLQLAAVHLTAAVTDTLAVTQVDRIGYTAGPIIEELVKLGPLVVAGLALRARRQWGLTDHVVLGAAVGAGFGLMEALLRYSAIAIVAPVRTQTGWGVPVGFNVVFVPEWAEALRSWLPAAASTDPTQVIPTAAVTSQHLVWSAVAGLGLGMLVRGPRRWRWLGLGPIALACIDHMAWNYRAALPATTPGPAYDLAEAVGRLGPTLWLWPLVAMAAACVADRLVLRRRGVDRPELMLERERVERRPALGLAVQVAARPGWSWVALHRFVLLRRSALFDHQAALAGQLAEARHQLDGPDAPDAWRGLAPLRMVRDGLRQRGGRWWWVRLLVSLAVWLAILAPAVAYFGQWDQPRNVGVKQWFAGSTGFRLAVAVSVASLGWALWRTVASGRRLRQARHLPGREAAARLSLQLWTGAGAVALGAVALRRVTSGAGATDRLVEVRYYLSALLAVLLVTALVLLTMSVVGLPPLLLLAESLTLGDMLLLGGVTYFAVETLAPPPTIGGRRSPLGIESPSPPPRPGPFETALGGLAATVADLIPGGDEPQAGLRDPEQYADGDGNLRWLGTNELVSHNPVRPSERDDTAAEGGPTPSTLPPGRSPVAGFDTTDQILDFGDALRAGFAGVGVDDATFYLQGSAVTNRRFDSGEPFGPDSDYDVLIVSDNLVQQARQAGLDFRSDGTSRPVDSRDLAEQVGLDEVRQQLIELVGRRVSFRLAPSSAPVPSGGTMYIPSRAG